MSSGGSSVWYQWTAERDATVTFDTTGSAADLSATVYSGDSLAGLAKVGGGKKVVFRAQGGRTYRIAVDGAYGATGTVNLSVIENTPPGNDPFAAAEELTGEADSTSGTTVYAGYETGERAHVYGGSASVWYRWTAPRTGLVRIDLTSSSEYIYAIAYSGSSLNGLTQVKTANRVQGMRFRAVEGTTYRIAIDGVSSQSADFGLSSRCPTGRITTTSRAPRSSAEPRTRRPARTSMAPVEPGEPSAYTANGLTVWYRWTAPASGATTIDLGTSSFDTQAAVYTGTRVDSLTKIIGQRTRRLSFYANEGTTYSIQVDGYYAAGDVGLALTMVPSPPNDAFARAASLSGDSGTTPGTTVNATREASEPTHGGTGSASVWYAWTAPHNGLLRLDVRGTGFTPLLAIHTGDRVDSLNPRHVDVRRGPDDPRAPRHDLPHRGRRVIDGHVHARPRVRRRTTARRLR